MASAARGAGAEKERAEALARMDLRKIVRAYIQQMVDEVPGYKALLLDKETMRICSTLYGRTELADHSVFHVERIDGTVGKDHMELKVEGRDTDASVARASQSMRSSCRLHPGHPVAPPCRIAQAVCFLRPTRENITFLKRELRQPRYQSYHLCEAHDGAAGGLLQPGVGHAAAAHPCPLPSPPLTCRH